MIVLGETRIRVQGAAFHEIALSPPVQEHFIVVIRGPGLHEQKRGEEKVRGGRGS